MEIGEVVSNGQGVAVLEFTPQQSGETQIVARYEAIEITTMLILAKADEHFYQPKISPLAPTGRRAFIGPKSGLGVGDVEGEATPTPALRIPGGFGAWLLAYVFTVILVWSLYFRVMYQMFRIPIVGEIRDIDTRLVPLVGMAVMLGFVILLVLMLITGP
jgi:hypothetical protein